MKKLFLVSSLVLFSCSESPRSLGVTPDLAGGGSAPDMSSPDAGSFQPMAPNIQLVNPKSISTVGGGQITLTGGPFYPTTTFFINGQLTQVMSVTTTQAVLVAPPKLGIGQAKITAVNPNGLTSSNSNTKGSATAFAFFASQISFSQASYLTQASQPRGAAFGDLNGDGFLDAIVTHVGAGTYTVLLGNGTGAFSPLYMFGFTPTGPTFTTTGTQLVNNTTQLVDLNADGKLDLLTGTTVSTGSYYLGNGTGLVNQIAASNAATAAGAVTAQTVADINGDTLPDLITATAASATSISMFLNTNNPNALFPTTASATLNPVGANNGAAVRVMAADLDGDKKPDLVTLLSGNGQPTLAVYMGNGATTAPFFTAANPLTYGSNAMNQNPQWFDLGDVNGDGKIDCVISNNTTNSVQVYLGNGSANNTFNAPLNPIPVGLLPQQLVLGDFNGDGKLDIVVANRTSDNISLLVGNGDGTFGQRQDFSSLRQPWAVYAQDFNGDGRLDIGVVDQADTTNAFPATGGYLTIYTNNSQ